MRESLLLLIIGLLYLFVPIKYSCMIYQQNHYHMDRYLHWLKVNWHSQRNWRILLVLCSTYLCFLLPSAFRREGFYLLLLVICYLSYKIESQITYRVPLKATFRIKRFMIAEVLLALILLLGYAYLPVLFQILLAPILFALPFVLIILGSMVMEPIERLIQEHYVKDARRILEQHEDLMIIGITGSYGKTSVKNILFTLLSSQFDTLKTPKSYNNKMGITLTIRQSLRSVHELFLCEMGADHVGEISDMMRFVQPDIGIVTAIGPQHLQTFHSIENIIKEKMHMVEDLPVHGIGFLNADNVHIRSHPLRTRCRIVWFGKDTIADYRITSLQMHGRGTRFTITYQEESVAFTTSLLGEHNVYNICCGIAVAHCLGIDFASLQPLVAKIPYVEHRLQIVSTSPYTLIDDAYNANPVGARNALEVLAQMKERTIIVTPGMIDLGEREDLENRLFGKHMAHCVDEVILVGERATTHIRKGLLEEGFSSAHLHVCENFTTAMSKLSQIVMEGDVVLLENDLPDAFAH